MRRADGVSGGRVGRPAPWAWTALAVPALGIAMLSPAAHGAARFAARLAAAAATLSRQAPWRQPAFVFGSPFEGGYEQGGYLEPVSCSPRFGHAIRSLYRAAVAEARGTG